MDGKPKKSQKFSKAEIEELRSLNADPRKRVRKNDDDRLIYRDFVERVGGELKEESDLGYAEGMAASEKHARNWEKSVVPSLLGWIQRQIPNFADQCLSDDNKTAWNGYYGYLSLCENALTALKIFDGHEPLKRLQAAFRDADRGIQNKLFKVPHEPTDPTMSLPYHVIMGTSCALITSLNRELEWTKERAAREVAKILSVAGISWPKEIRRSQSPQWKRLLNLHYKVQRGDPTISEDALAYFHSRRDRDPRDVLYLMKEDGRLFYIDPNAK